MRMRWTQGHSELDLGTPKSKQFIVEPKKMFLPDLKNKILKTSMSYGIDGQPGHIMPLATAIASTDALQINKHFHI